LSAMLMPSDTIIHIIVWAIQFISHGYLNYFFY
jgi:uncharacterized membrane protein YGL010W